MLAGSGSLPFNNRSCRCRLVGHETLAILRHDRLANAPRFRDLVFLLENVHLGEQGNRGREALRIVGRQTLVGNQRFITFSERLQIRGHRHSSRPLQLMRRILIDKRLKRRVRFAEFFFLPLLFGQEKMGGLRLPALPHIGR